MYNRSSSVQWKIQTVIRTKRTSHRKTPLQDWRTPLVLMRVNSASPFCQGQSPLQNTDFQPSATVSECPPTPGIVCTDWIQSALFFRQIDNVCPINYINSLLADKRSGCKEWFCEEKLWRGSHCADMKERR